MTVMLHVLVICPLAGMYKQTNATTFTAQLHGAVDPLSCIIIIYEILKSYKSFINHMEVWI
jgi:hypothetical protein